MAKRLVSISVGLIGMIAAASASLTTAVAGTMEIFHADSLAGPMREVKKAFEAKNAGVTINLTPGTSKQLAERILNGEVCDVFASSSPAVIEQDLMGKSVGGKGEAAAWYVIFSANEMVVITPRGNPLGIRQVTDLAKPGVTFTRITGDKDLGTGRTVEFLKRATTLEGQSELAQKITDGAIQLDPSKPASVPDVVNAVKSGRANAGVVYYSAAVAAGDDVDIVRFPASVNMTEAIRNAATVPGTAKETKDALAFVRFLLTSEAHAILTKTGQPPVVPAIRKGAVPADFGG